VRAGLHVVELGGRFYLMGGRTPEDSPIPGVSMLWADVWTSDDDGVSWTRILESGAPGHWLPRAYFQAVTKGSSMYVVGGQDFGIMSNFYNDVWKSEDGVEWTLLTADAGWTPRAGLRAVVFNDVWKSADGVTWQQMTADAPWEPRAGAVVVVKDGYMVLLGGEDGFLCEPQPNCELPYFNDDWRYALPSP